MSSGSGLGLGRVGLGGFRGRLAKIIKANKH